MNGAVHIRDSPVIFSLIVALELEGELNLGAISYDVAVVDLHVELDDLGDAKIAQALRCHIDGSSRGLLPRLSAGTNELDHFINAFSHDFLLLFRTLIGIVDLLLIVASFYPQYNDSGKEKFEFESDYF